MKIFANKDIKNFFLAISVIWTVFLLLAEGFEWLLYQKFSLYLLLLSLLAAPLCGEPERLCAAVPRQDAEAGGG